MNLKNTAYFFISAISLVLILVYGQNLLIPFIFALLFWFIVRQMKFTLNRVPFIRNKFPNWTKSLITSIVILVVILAFTTLISYSMNSLAHSYEKYQANVDTIVLQINETFNIDLVGLLADYSGDINFGSLLSAFFNSFSAVLNSTFMVIIYAAFIFLEAANFQVKLERIFTDKNRYHQITKILISIERAIAKYLGLKTLVSLITGLFSYFVLLAIGIDSPFFWAFLIFILNFIPTIGSLVATLFPAIFCLLQFGEFMPGILVLVLVGAVQLLVGNVLEPKFMGNSMNLSALVTIIALSFWGALWGITGMILSIPITVIMVIIFSQIPSTRPIAIMLSEKGNIEDSIQKQQ